MASGVHRAISKIHNIYQRLMEKFDFTRKKKNQLKRSLEIIGELLVVLIDDL